MEAAKNMLMSGHQGNNLVQSIGWPFILAIVFAMFGISNMVALNASIVFGALTVINVFLITSIVTRNTNLGLISAALFSLFPAHIRWSATAANNVSSLFFVTLAIFFTLLYFKNKTNSLLWLSVLSLSFVSQFRPENYALPFLFFIGMLIYDAKLFQKINIKFILPWIIFALLALPNFVQVADFQLSTNWIESDSLGSLSGDNWSLQNFLHNSFKYGPFLFFGDIHAISITLLFFIGLGYFYWTRRKDALFLTAWFSLFWIIYFTSWFQTLAGPARFYTSFYPVIAIVASYGALFIYSTYINRIKNYLTKRATTTFLIALLFISLISTTNHAAYLDADTAHQLETEIPELAEKQIPHNCVILTSQPLILTSTTNLTAISISYFMRNPNKFNEIMNDGNCLLFFEDYFCKDFTLWGTDKDCHYIRSNFFLTEYKSYRHKEKVYTFYNITRLQTMSPI